MRRLDLRGSLPPFFSDRPVTRVFLAIAVAAYLAVLLLDGVAMSGGFGMFGPTGLAAFAAGSYMTVAVHEHGQWERAAASGIIHGGLLHLLLNAACIMRLGGLLETLSGSRRTLLVFGLSQAGAAAAVSLGALVEGVPQNTVGASGIACGIAAALWVQWCGERRTVLDDHRRDMAVFLVLSLLYGLVPGISFLGHLGGIVGGVVAGLLLRRRAGIRVKGDRLATALDLTGWLLAALFIAGTILAAVRAPARLDVLKRWDPVIDAAAQVSEWSAGAPFDPLDREGFERTLAVLGDEDALGAVVAEVKAAFARFLAAGPGDAGTEAALDRAYDGLDAALRDCGIRTRREP